MSSQIEPSLCLGCEAPQDYDSTCHPQHSKYFCSACFTKWVESELSNSPSHGCRCPICREDLNDNDIVQALLPRQQALQEAKRQADVVSMNWRGLFSESTTYSTTTTTTTSVTINGGIPMESQNVDIATIDSPRWRGGRSSTTRNSTTSNKKKQYQPVRGFETPKERCARQAANRRALEQFERAHEKWVEEEEERMERKRREEESRPVDLNILGPYDEEYWDGEEDGY